MVRWRIRRARSANDGLALLLSEGAVVANVLNNDTLGDNYAASAVFRLLLSN
jgi:hypothetical protein